jgi:RNA polymerase sigma factor (sigma-70 family)
VRDNVLVRPANDELDRLYREQFPQLMRLAYVLTGSNDLAEEVVQDVFVRVADRIVRIEHPPSYLRAAVINAIRSRHRHQARRTQVPMVDEAVLPTELVELRDVLLGLSERQRTAVVLRYIAGVSDAEIAAILGCREATVRSLVARGLHELRRVVP